MPVQKMEMVPLLLPSDEQGKLLEHVTDLTPLSELVLPVATSKAILKLLGEHNHASKLKDHGLRPANRILFHGPPGTGKTASAGAFARGLGIPLVSVRHDALVQSFMGKTAAALRLVFEFASTNRAVILVDEADAIARERADGKARDGAAAEMGRVVNSFLTMLEEQRKHSQSVVIAATNHEHVIDHAMWRRFDAVVKFEMPNETTAGVLMGKLLKRYGYNAVGIDRPTARAITRSLKGLSFADIERVVMDAVKTATIDESVSIQGALLEAVATERRRRRPQRRGVRG